MEIKSIQKFNTVNSIALLTMSLWGYIDTNSFTALIPAVFGTILFILGMLLNKEKLVKMVSPCNCSFYTFDFSSINYSGFTRSN